ncbi:MAG: hypothetical protein IJH71_06950 [Eubacterium sp.]|nr:hypothetical protein [Eubacterium sp.]
MATRNGKVDINLANLSDENMSADMTEDMQARQNIETGMRYINIAEHMNLFEDQDKYYHRAITYLKKARDYFTEKGTFPELVEELTEMHNDLSRKKFTVRAEGKLELYQEACQIRDKAKTPTDYSSAQQIFERIHKHEVGHKLNAKWTDPELFEAASKCDDSEKQAEICAELAQKKEASLKRQSLFLSIAVVAAAIGFILFTRTIQFKSCQGFFNGLVGDPTGAWQAYENVYQRTGDERALKNYEKWRYKAAKVLQEEKDTLADAIGNYRALAELGYKDSEEQLVRLELQRLRDSEADGLVLGDKIAFANMDWRILERNKEEIFLIKDNSMANIPFNKGGGNVTWEKSSVRKWLNEDFLNENFFEKEKEVLIVSKVPSSTNPEYGTKSGNATEDYLYLLSSEEVAQYQPLLAKTQNCWWLRTPGKEAGLQAFVYTDTTTLNFGFDSGCESFAVKPVVRISLK